MKLPLQTLVETFMSNQTINSKTQHRNRNSEAYPGHISEVEANENKLNINLQNKYEVETAIPKTS